MNWRLRAIRSLENHDQKSLHYSSVVSVSVEDYYRIREILANELVSLKAIIKESTSALAVGFSIDLFEI